MKKLLIILILSISLIPVRSMAADEYKLLEPLPCLNGVTDPKNCKDGFQEKIEISSYVLYVYKMSIALAVFLAIIMIIWGGFLYITSETPFKIEDGKSKIQNAATGLAMVLVSYLILLTIDPRLVNVDTEIPKIKYKEEDLKAIKNFQTELANDLKNLSLENQLKVNENNSKIQTLEKEKLDIKARFERGEIGGETANSLTAKVEQEINALTVEKKVIVANNNGLVSFYRAIEIIENPSETSSTDLQQYIANPIPNTEGSNLRPIDSPNAIQNQYNQQINNLLKAGGNNFEKIQNLEKQRDFYIAQVKEEVSLDAKIKENGRVHTGNQGSVYKIDNSKYLNEKLKEYKTNLTDTQKINSSGLNNSEYTKIIETRINRIDQILNPPKK